MEQAPGRVRGVRARLWGSQSWLPLAFSRRLRGSKTRACPKKPPERRLQARLPAPQNWQNVGRTTLVHIVGRTPLVGSRPPGRLFAGGKRWIFRASSGSRGTRADLGVCPTDSAQMEPSTPFAIR